MKTKIITYFIITSCLGFMCGKSMCFAEETVATLKAEIRALQDRVADLETDKQSPSVRGDLFLHGNTNRWDPFREMERMQAEMDKMFRNSFSAVGSPGQGMFSSSMSFDADLDLEETADGYKITFDMTGLDQEKTDIQINEESITVKGEQSRQDTQESDNAFFNAKSYNSFMRTIPLPADADTTKIQTKKKGDKLIITLPKKTS